MIRAGGHHPDGRRDRGRTVLLPALAAAVALLVAGGGLGQAPRGESRLRADRFVDRMIGGEPVSCMYGNVFIDRDTLTAASDSAFFYRDREVYEFVGRVRLTRDQAVMTCDFARYNRNFGTGDYRGDVRIVEGDVVGTGDRAESRANGRYLRLMGDALLVTPDYSVRGDTIFQDRQTGRGEAFGNVKIMEPGARNLVTGDHAVFHDDGGTAEVDRRPVLVSREQSGGPVRSTAGLMRFYRTEDRVVMVDTVRIRQGRTLAQADTAVAYGRDRMVLTGNPSVAMDDRSVMYGDRLEFFYDGGELRRLIITGDGRMEDAGPDSLAAVYQGLPTMDILEGDSITVDFEDRKLRRSVVVGSAHSLYTPRDLTDEVATNDVTGDTITIHFRRQKVARVKVLGNADGRYRFARVAAMRDMLGKSRRMADLLARGAADTSGSAVDSLGAAIDSLAGAMGLPVADMADGVMDSLLAVALDSLAAAGYDTGQAAMDFLAAAQEVKYGGRTVTFVMSDRTMELEDDAHLEYGTLNLKAGHIKLDTDDRELYADHKPLVEDQDTIAGERMGYNFKYKSAAVEDGVTAMDDYYYVGDSIRRFEDQTMKICGGRMTSCDREEPHYHFWTGDMKMRPGDKVVAAPIVLRIGHVPVFALPFYYKSLKEGRQSGILFPNFDFGWSSREGRYIRDFGYYWATNDYTDFLFEADYNERREFAYRIENAYIKRYSFNGGVSYSRRIGLGDDPVREWQFRWNHNQPTLWDDYKFRADVKMASRTLSRNDLNGAQTRDIVSGNLGSSAYLSRNWSLANVSLNASRDERTNAGDDDPKTNNLISSMTLPSFSLGFRQLTLAPSLRRGEEGSLVGDVLRNVYFKQGYSFKSGRQEYEERKLRTYDAAGNWSLSYRPPRLGIFNVSFAANGSQTWRREEDSGREWTVVPTAESEPDSGYYTDYDRVEETTNPGLGFSTSLGTTLYGIFPMKVGRLRALRHTMKFNTTWTGRPALGDRQRHNSSFSLGLDNRFDLKYLGADSDTTVTEKKLDGVLDWSLNTNYDPQPGPGQREWGDLSSSLTIKPGENRYLKLKVSNGIDPYLWALKSTRFSYGVNFSGRVDVGKVPEEQEQARNAAIDRLGIDPAAAAADTVPTDPFADEFDAADVYGDVENFDGENSSFYDMYNRPGRMPGGDDGKDPTEGGRFIPFNAGANLSYNYVNQSRSKTATASVNMRAQLTRNWDITYSAQFNLVEGTTTRQQYSLNRDLHCWRFEFTRTVSSYNSEFGFRIYLMSIPDLKFTRGIDNFGSAPGALGGGIF